MKLIHKIHAAGSLASAILLKRRIPLIVAWSLTNRCNKRCLYCATWKNAGKELNTDSILSLIDQFGQLGTRIISFTGGEPLMRDDIGSIVNHIKQKDMYVKINTNGAFLPKKITRLKLVDEIKLDLDGPPEIHDMIRGQNSYNEVIEAIRVAKKHTIKVSLITVVSKYNIRSIGHILEVAKKYDAIVDFQPARDRIYKTSDPNPIAPSANEYKEVMRELITRKKKGESVANSISCLSHLSHWPEGQTLHCRNRRLSCRIEPNGDMVLCGLHPYNEMAQVSNCKDVGVKKAFNALPEVVCKHCWCAPRIELNYLLKCDMNSLWNMLCIK